MKKEEKAFFLFEELSGVSEERLEEARLTVSAAEICRGSEDLWRFWRRRWRCLWWSW